MSLRRLLLPALILALPSCQMVLGFENFGASDSDGSGGGSAEACAGLQESGATGTRMLPALREDGSCFWIDEHEVTRQEYAAFATSNPPGLSLPCSWNEDYYDSDCEDASDRIVAEDDHPQVCVDQCDAEEYCRSVGKTLCRSSFAGIAEDDDWASACTNAGETALPYGSTGDASVCNIQDSGAGDATSDVLRNTSCENDFGVRDLVGNVAEWVGGDDACSSNSGVDDQCLVRGGSFIDPFQTARCSSSATPERGDTFDYVGIRCCAYVE